MGSLESASRGRIMRLIDRVKKALEADQSIVMTLEQAKSHAGFSTEHFEQLGLRKIDLKKLRLRGLALLGYARPDGSKDGHRARWVLIADSQGDVYGEREEVQEVSAGQDSSKGKSEDTPQE